MEIRVRRGKSLKASLDTEFWKLAEEQNEKAVAHNLQLII